ncbi:nucleoside deaminase [Sulfuricurvum sp.]|uniref:nucleoside deaminase n=1 Tax=Sulfuricurvum sp. TaxID=2025608 RepID=UPI003BB0D691
MNRWMQIAYEEALSGMRVNDGGPFGAVIVQNDQIISQTHNEVLRTNDPTAHAEINAIRAASQKLGRFDLSDCTLYTTCYPCPMCMGAILWAKIPIVYYGATEADATKGGFNDENFHAHIRNPQDAFDLRPLDLEKTRTLFDQWLEKSDRILY